MAHNLTEFCQDKKEKKGKKKDKKAPVSKKMIQKGMTHCEKADNRVDAFFLAL